MSPTLPKQQSSLLVLGILPMVRQLPSNINLPAQVLQFWGTFLFCYFLAKVG
jgi:hypothetical protein